MEAPLYSEFLARMGDGLAACDSIQKIESHLCVMAIQVLNFWFTTEDAL